MKADKGETNPLNTSAFVQVLGVGTDTGVTVPSVLLFFDRHRYLFNVGEGFQRFCVDHRVKLAKMESVLMTRVTTEASGGLPGMLITMSDTGCGGLLAGHASLTLHGPQGLGTLVNAFRTFVNVKDMGLQVAEFGEEGVAGEGQEGVSPPPPPVIKNDVVTISPVVIKATPGDGLAGGGDAPDAKRARVDPSMQSVGGPNGPFASSAGGVSGSETTTCQMPSISVETPAACYLCELPPVPGKFLPQKAAALGVPKGPLYGKLSRGESVTTPNGRLVLPEEVKEPTTPGPVVLVVDCPSPAFLPALTSAPGLARWTQGEEADRVACLVHLAERSVTRLPAYRAWMGRFPPSATHVLVGESQGRGVPTLKGFGTLQAKLNALDPLLFPLMHLRDAAGGEAADDVGKGCVIGSNMLRYHLRPLAKKGLDTEECSQPLDAAEVQRAFREGKPEVFGALGEADPSRAAEGVAREGPQPPACVLGSRRREVEVTFLGTGAAVPSKYRNVTSIFVNLFDRGCLFMDAGEGAYSQLRRRYGPAQADDFIKRLGCIWISHIHADHHVGLPALLAARTRLLGPDCPPLLVLGPRPLRRALQVYAQLEPMRFLFLEASTSAVAPPGATSQVQESSLAAIASMREALGLTRFESVRVDHCAHAYALCMEGGGAGEAAWKVVFSADTRPCDALVEVAKGATLLIHEATFDDSLLDEAVAKRHSTIGEAVEVGARAGAFLTMLTHFSQRYPKVPVIDREGMQGNVGVAYDMMSLNLADLPRAPRLVPALGLMFAEPEPEEEDAQPA